MLPSCQLTGTRKTSSKGFVPNVKAATQLIGDDYFLKDPNHIQQNRTELSIRLIDASDRHFLCLTSNHLPLSCAKVPLPPSGFRLPSLTSLS